MENFRPLFFKYFLSSARSLFLLRFQPRLCGAVRHCPTALRRAPPRLPVLFSLCVSVWVTSAESPLAERSLPVSGSEAFSIHGRLGLSVPVPFFPLTPSLSMAVRYSEQKAAAGPLSVQFLSHGACAPPFKDMPVTDSAGAAARVASMNQARDPRVLAHVRF